MINISQVIDFTTYKNNNKENFYLNDPNSKNELLKIFYPNIEKTKREEISLKGWPNEKTNTFEPKQLNQILKKNISLYSNLENILKVDEYILKKNKIPVYPYKKILSYIINNFYIYNLKPAEKEIEEFIYQYFQLPQEDISSFINNSKKIILKYEDLIKKNNIKI